MTTLVSKGKEYLGELQLLPLPSSTRAVIENTKEDSVHAIVLGTAQAAHALFQTTSLPKASVKPADFHKNHTFSAEQLKTASQDFLLEAAKSTTTRISDEEKRVIADIRAVSSSYIKAYSERAFSLTQHSMPKAGSRSLISRVVHNTLKLTARTIKITAVTALIFGLIGSAGIAVHSYTCALPDWTKTCRAGEKTIVDAVRNYVSPGAAQWLNRNWTQLAMETSANFINFVNSRF